MFRNTYVIQMLHDFSRELARMYVLPSLNPPPKAVFNNHRCLKQAPINKPRPRCRT